MVSKVIIIVQQMIFKKDIDECTSKESSCDHSCVNTEGSYNCICHTGYSLGSDNHTCVGRYTIVHNII